MPYDTGAREGSVSPAIVFSPFEDDEDFEAEEELNQAVNSRRRRSTMRLEGNLLSVPSTTVKEEAKRPPL